MFYRKIYILLIFYYYKKYNNDVHFTTVNRRTVVTSLYHCWIKKSWWKFLKYMSLILSVKYFVISLIYSGTFYFDFFKIKNKLDFTTVDLPNRNDISDLLLFLFSQWRHSFSFIFNMKVLHNSLRLFEPTVVI